MIEAIKKFANGYRAAGIKEVMGSEGLGWSATIMKNGRVLGDAVDYADGGPVNIRFANKDDRDELLVWAKLQCQEYRFEQDAIFLELLVNYEIAVKDLKAKAKKMLLEVDYSELDEYGIAKSFNSWKLADTPENRAKVLARFPDTRFLNDELAKWESIRKPRQ